MLAAGVEWARLCGLGGAGAVLYAAGLGLGFAALYNVDLQWPALVLAAAFWIFAAPFWMWRGVSARPRVLLACGLVVILPAALAMAALSPRQLLLVLVLVWVADSAAYFAGRRWGRRKLAPSISPGKTLEGALGGLLGAMAYAIICGTFLEDLAWGPYVVAAALLAVLSIVGDLFESAVKRQAGAKDSGTLLPGHGGILDRIDSATAVLPVAALALPWIGAR